MEVLREPAEFVKAKGVEASHATLHLTRLDQIRNYYYPIVLFYKGKNCKLCGLFYSSTFSASLNRIPVKEDVEQSSDSPQKDDAAALQAVRRGIEAMVDHYPWVAGRLRVVKQLHSSQYGEEEQECLEVCIDEDGGPGVQFVGARVNCPLHSLGDLSNPNPAFEPLFANVDEKLPYRSRPLLAFQVSRFECGGFCVSMNSNHVLFDGVSASTFLQNMGSCARGKGLCLPLDLAPRELRIYPRIPPSPKLKCSLNVMHKKDFKYFVAKQGSFYLPLVATKFVFTEYDLAKLRSHALSKQEDCKRGFQACSRFQVLTAHVWKAKARCMMALYGDPSLEFRLHVPVNVREHVMESIPKNYVGNAYGVATPSASLRELNEMSLALAVEVIQDAIERVSPECFQSDLDHLEILGANACFALPYMAVVCLSNLGFYDIDFGWEKPMYFGRHFKQARNRVIIMDGNSERTSLNVWAAFISEDELVIFQDALKWEPSHH